MALETLKKQEEALKQELAKLERRVYDMETQYMGAEFTQLGTVFKGFEAFLTTKDQQRRRGRPVDIRDRLFSLSSKPSPAQEELRTMALEQGIDPNQTLVRILAADRLQRKAQARVGG